MARTHYEVLQVSPDASRAEIRMAYRAACLRTHPDKVKPEDKKKAEYEFRRVQQAYEVLSDDEKRKAYDYQRTNPGADRTFQYQYQNTGEWGWPQHPFFQDSFAGASSSRGRPQDPFSHPFFNDDFFSRPFGRSPFSSFGWPFGGGRDPFEDMMSSHRRMADDLSRMAAHFQSATNPFPSPPPNQQSRSDTSTNNGQRNQSSSTRTWSFSGSFNSDGGRWVSESHTESWINGQRQTTHKRRDANGVEHVTHTYPDGTTRYLVNGVEQALPPPEGTSTSSQPPRAIDSGRSDRSFRRNH